MFPWDQMMFDHHSCLLSWVWIGPFSLNGSHVTIKHYVFILNKSWPLVPSTLPPLFEGVPSFLLPEIKASNSMQCELYSPFEAILNHLHLMKLTAKAPENRDETQWLQGQTMYRDEAKNTLEIWPIGRAPKRNSIFQTHWIFISGEGPTPARLQLISWWRLLRWWRMVVINGLGKLRFFGDSRYLLLGGIPPI